VKFPMIPLELEQLRALALADPTARPQVLEKKLSHLPDVWRFWSRKQQASWLQQVRLASDGEGPAPGPAIQGEERYRHPPRSGGAPPIAAKQEGTGRHQRAPGGRAPAPKPWIGDSPDPGSRGPAGAPNEAPTGGGPTTTPRKTTTEAGESRGSVGGSQPTTGPYEDNSSQGSQTKTTAGRARRGGFASRSRRTLRRLTYSYLTNGASSWAFITFYESTTPAEQGAFDLIHPGWQSETPAGV